MSSIETVIASDGVTIGCHTAGQGPPLLLVHGGGGDHSRWTNLLGQLNERFTTYAMDRRGRGASSDGTGMYDIEAEFNDIAAVIDAIGSPVDVLAHSFGALCALEATLRTPHVRRLALYEPPLPVGVDFYPAGFVEHLSNLLDAGDRDGLVAAMFTQTGTRASDLATMRDLPVWRRRVDAAHTIPREMQAISGVYQPDFGRFARITVPVMLLLGSDSPQPLKLATECLYKVLPDVREVVLNGQAHFAMDTAPDMFLREILTFFE
ncbi:pimeloyl-ACP methyl ester carboxylesterase [Mycobacterium frederiksbergense]|uniref:Pimeloyl-ACP methyl ester carboxylesterase n=1 Tax=Mycolicibacterium frederiksbergense TaxID=117567 RepID=A0ABT6KTU2_9MYCO|nr:alpha/beta hydrolase [Mycolicibacterium frederiksbergense]MDH6194097.1 pimeloyl-ACP methyl ester carboxylesterase [Mycolicibacterium frederiksbergense]